MEPIRREKVERQPEVEPDDTQRVLQEIAEDARTLKSKYLDDTVVPEGGE